MNENNELVLEAKGRNGYFQVDSTRVITLQNHTHLLISVNSRRNGSSSPIYFEGTVEDVASYFDAIGQAIRETSKNHSIAYINKKGEISHE